MECSKRLTHGMNGTRRYQHPFGDRLLFDHNRHDKLRQRRLTTVELIVDDKPFPSARIDVEKALFHHPNKYVELRVRYHEADLRALVKTNGGKLLPENKRCRLPYHVAVKLRLKDRIERGTGNGVWPNLETNDQ